MLLRSRFVLGSAAVAAAAAFAVPLAARTLAVASAGPETVLAPPSVAPAGGVPATIGTDGTNFALFNWAYSAQRVSPTGALLDPTEIKFPYPTGNVYSDLGSTLAVAPSANGYLCVWNTYGVSLAHLDASLGAVETTPTTLATTSSFNDALVGIAKGTSGYLVAWVEEDGDATNGSIHAQLLDASGAAVGSALSLGPDASYMTGPAVAYGGGNYEIVWGAMTSLVAVHVSEAGALLDATPKTIATTLSAATAPVIGATATEHVVAWRDAPGDGGVEGIAAARIAFDGTIRDPGGVSLLASAQPSTLAYSPGTGLVMGWQLFGNNPPYAGVIDETTLTLRSQGGLPGSAYSTALVATNGTTVLGAWGDDQSTTQASVLSSTGRPESAAVTLGWTTGHNGASQIASSGSGYFVAWQTGAPGAAGAIWGRLLDATGTPLGPPILVTVPPNGFIGDPIVVWTGAEYVVLFPVGQGTWYTVRVDPSGNVIDTYVGNIDIPTGDTVSFIGGNDHLFAIVATGQEVDVDSYDGTPSAFMSSTGGVPIYFTATQASATWLDATHLEVAFVGGPSLYASVVDTTAMTAKDPVTIATDFYGYTKPLAARGQYETAVAASPPDGGSMFVYRLDTSGALIDGPYATQSVPGASSTSLLWDGARYVLAWSQQSADGGTVAYASDLGSAASPFGLSGALTPFAENVIPAGPAIVPFGDGGALLVATRDISTDTSVVGVAWTSGDKLPALPVPDAGTDGGTDAGPGVSADAGSDAGPSEDAATIVGNPDDAGPSSVVGDDAGVVVGVDASAFEPVDSGPIASDASAPVEDGGASGGASGSSGCSCRVGPQGGSAPWPAAAAVLFVGLALARRRSSRHTRKKSTAALYSHTHETSPDSWIRSSAVTRGASSTRAAATMKRSAGSP